MTDQTWEYCELGLGSWEKKEIGKGAFKPKETIFVYDCYIRYYKPGGGEIFLSLAKLDAPLDYNPFSKAMGFLGANGWELVSVQHGNKYGGGGQMGWSSSEYAIGWDNRVAYFKRPIVKGRAVDEPKI